MRVFTTELVRRPAPSGGDAVALRGPPTRFEHATGWRNSSPLTAEDLAGRVVLVGLLDVHLHQLAADARLCPRLVRELPRAGICRCLMSTKGSKMADGVQVEKRRLDASENDALIGMARMGADAFGYKADLRIDRQLAQLLRLRVSQLNNCTYCLSLHYEATRDAGIPRAKIDTLTAWWETELFSEAEHGLSSAAAPKPRSRTDAGSCGAPSPRYGDDYPV